MLKNRTYLKSLTNGNMRSACILLALAAGSTNARTGIDDVYCFEASNSWAVGTSPLGIAIGDLNNDGYIDQVTADSANGEVMILLGIGDGTFFAWTTEPANSDPQSVALGDLNGDGFLDIVTANLRTAAPDQVNVLLYQGGGYTNPTSFGTGDGTRCVKLGDVNGDGDLDIVASNVFQDTVSVLLGNGDGTFAAQQVVSTGAGPNRLVLDDLDNDGDLDIATANQSDDTASVLLNNGDGTYAAATHVAVGDLPRDIAAGDYNNDGLLDLVTANTADGTVSVLANNGGGSFGVFDTFAVGTAPSGIAMADLDENGHAEVVVANRDDNTASIYAFSLNQFSLVQTKSVGSEPIAIATGDLDGDGDLDIATANRDGDSTSTVINSTGECVQYLGSFEGRDYFTTIVPLDMPTTTALLGSFASDRGMTAGDHLSLASLNSAAEESYLIGLGADNWWIGFNDADVEGDFVWSNGDPVGYTNWLDGEPNDDGIGEDFAVMNWAGTGSWNDLPGSVERRAVFELETDVACFGQSTVLDTVGRSARDVVFADVDDDGNMDVIAGGNSNDGRGVSLLRGNGDGSFQAFELLSSRGVSTVSVADMDDDGDLDIAALDPADEVIVLLNDGGGNFSAAPVHDLGSFFATQIALGDLNEDGFADLIGAGHTTGGGGIIRYVAVWLGNGDGTFAALQTYSGGVNDGRDIEVADINGDGFLDVSVLRNGGVRILYGLGDGTLPQWYSPGGTFGEDDSFTFADIDGDGDLDMIAGGDDRFVRVRRQLATGAFMPAEEFDLGANLSPLDLMAADVDGDGDLDIISASKKGSTAEGFLTVLPGVGDGSFHAPRSFGPTIDSPIQMAMADIDGDGDLDVALANLDEDNQDVAIIRNRTGECPADVNGDCTLDFFDVLAFLSDWSAISDRADFNSDSLVDFFDVLSFLEAFSVGCS